MLGVGTLKGGMVGMPAGAMLALALPLAGGGEGAGGGVEATPRDGGRLERGALPLLAALAAPAALFVAAVADGRWLAERLGGGGAEL
jgi:hypothetical protein